MKGNLHGITAGREANPEEVTVKPHFGVVTPTWIKALESLMSGVYPQALKHRMIWERFLV